MPALGLCMMVRDEQERIEACLSDIVDLFAEVVVIDTGSRDHTCGILRDGFGIEPWCMDPAHGSYVFHHSAVRNQGFARLTTPWILSLDADERIERDALEAFTALPDEPSLAGYFTPWITYRPERPPLEDYKLVLFRKGLERRGIVHENVQYQIREHGLDAVWYPDLVIRHYPETRKDPLRSEFYRLRLEKALEAEPDWHRYRWFLGYMHYQENRWADAVHHLGLVATSRAAPFPVECLNAAMVLVEIHARSGHVSTAGRVLEQARAFYETVADDFEVRVNFRLESWLDSAGKRLRDGQASDIRSYPFAY